jgi:hypothetical protein
VSVQTVVVIAAAVALPRLAAMIGAALAARLRRA